MFKKKKELKVGLNLGSSSIKAVILEEENNNYTLRNFVVKDSPHQADIPELVKDALSDLDAQGTAVGISLSGQDILTRYVTVTNMNEKEFRNALKFEAQKYIPFPIDQVYVDGCILRQNVTPNKMLVLVAAAKKAFVDTNLKLLQDLGCSVKVVDIDCLALVNAFNFSCSEDESLQSKSIALLDVGAYITNLNILEKGMPCLSRDIQIGGNHFTIRIADDLSLDFTKAEELKKSNDQKDLLKIKPSIDTVLTQFASEVRKSFDYYESQSVSSVEKIFLSGGGSRLAGFSEGLSKALGIEVSTWDPLTKFKIATELEEEGIHNNSTQLAVAIGLAIRC